MQQLYLEMLLKAAMCKVSVIIPNYNHAAFLKQRIESVLSQSFTDLELIILDDFSTDDSKAVIETYKEHSKISHIVFNTQNSGSSFIQWKKGIELSKGKYLWIAESDDVADHSFLEKMMQRIDRDDNIMLATCRSAHINEHGDTLALNTWPDDGFDTTHWTNDFTNSGIDEISSYLKFRNTIPNASAVVFRNNVATELEALINLKWKYSGDWFFWASLISKGKIAYCSEVLNGQRHHIGTTRSSKSFAGERARFLETVQCVQMISDMVNEKINWADKRYAWIYDTYIERTGDGKKITSAFWNISPSFAFRRQLFVVWVKTSIGSLITRIQNKFSRNET